MMDQEQFKNQRVVVTGAGTGIGLRVARAFAQHGASVVFHYSHDTDAAEAEVDELRGRGASVLAVQADFRTLEPIQELASRAEAFLGGVDVLVNNAGITMNKPFHDTTPEQYDILYAVNVRAPFFLCQAMTRGMVKRGKGAVINLASVHAFQGMAQHSVYAGTKGAIMAFTRELAVELAPNGVRVNAIAPGAIQVENYSKAMPGYDPKAMANMIPAGFLGQPEDIAALALFLASDDSRYITGQTLIIDGGTSSWMPFNEGFKQPVGGQFGIGYVPGV